MGAHGRRAQRVPRAVPRAPRLTGTPRTPSPHIEEHDAVGPSAGGVHLAEPYYGNAGGMALPDGYLEQVYAAVRQAGGLCIADEVQVGYGRLGE